MLRKGKIARLPRLLRDELIRRLAANEEGASLLDWLNASPDVKALLARDFAGEPITKQNLHEWRDGGLLEWQARQDLFAEAADLTDANGEWDALAANDFTERLAAVLVVRYANALAGWNGGDDEAFRLKLRDLRRFNQDLAVLRRYNQTAARLKMEQLPFYREEEQRAEAAASARRQSEAGARAYDERLAQRRREAEAASKVVCAAPAAPVVSVPSASVAAMASLPAHNANGATAGLTVVDASVNTESPQTNRSGLISEDGLPHRSSANDAPIGVQPGAQAGVRPKPGKTKNDSLTISADDRPLASASLLGPQPRTSSSPGSTTTKSPLDTVVPVLIAPRSAVDHFVAANTRPPEAGLLPAALRREIFDALYLKK
jgi:hypothetical protein